MDDLLLYLDSVQIDVVKRKYYNANKVNAVFEEIRNQAEQLIQENERLKASLKEKEEEEQSSASAWNSLQETYRDILIKAHDRAEAIISDAKDRSAMMEKNAEIRCDRVARQLEDCINELRQREEQNIEFLNARMKVFLSEVYGEEKQEVSERSEPEKLPDYRKIDRYADTAAYEKNDLPDDLSSRIDHLSREIKALETEP